MGPTVGARVGALGGFVGARVGGTVGGAVGARVGGSVADPVHATLYISPLRQLWLPTPRCVQSRGDHSLPVQTTSSSRKAKGDSPADAAVPPEYLSGAKLMTQLGSLGLTVQSLLSMHSRTSHNRVRRSL